MADRYGTNDPYSIGGGGMAYGGSSDMPATPSSETKKFKDTEDQLLIPVTVRMILNSSNAILRDGREPKEVKLVGAVREVQTQSTNNIYHIEDGTGLIEVKEFLDANTDNKAVLEDRNGAAEDAVYVKVFGAIQEYEGRTSLVAYSVRKITTGNELTYHLLEVVHTSERFKKNSQIVGSPSLRGSMIMASNNQIVPQSTPVKEMENGFNQNPAMESLMTEFSNLSDEMAQVGISIKEFIGQNRHLREEDVNRCISDLVQEGTIYNTHDDDHYAKV